MLCRKIVQCAIFTISALVFISASTQRADAAGEIDPTFQPYCESGGPIAIQPDGKILSNLCRMNSDGSHDASFDSGSGVDEVIRAMAVQPNGQIIIVGDFETYNGIPRRSIARLNSDGSLDMGFDPGAYITTVWQWERVQSVAIQSDGKILIGGPFHWSNGSENGSGIMRFNNDGSLDLTFDTDISIGIGDGGRLTDIDVQSDGKILIGGDVLCYYNYDDPENEISECGGFFRLNSDGTVDQSLDVFNGIRYANVTLQPDGKILVAGENLVRYNNDGSIDATFNMGTKLGSGSVASIVVQSDGKILIGGAFLTYDGVTRNNIARIYSDTSLDTSFDAGESVNGLVGYLGIQSDGNIIAYASEGVGLVRIFAGSGSSNSQQSGTNTISATIAQNMTLSCGTDIDLNGGTPLIPQTPATSQTTCTVTTNDENGYDLQLTNDRGLNNALYHTTQSATIDGQITDKARWNPSEPNATNFAGTGLAFGVVDSDATKNTTWWGDATACTDTDQLYAGIPAATTAIMEHGNYSNTPTDTTICYQVNVPSTQISGLYEGSVTYTATGRP